ncbi:ligand-binding sensor domain-containing diguanylate cyclase [Agaribacter flavus]|uniref:diguanylate cyclase n=1 Tax=Agaribacter flavus TaxID=1902781 RepID=A0ABV7FNK2_9ALTE
MIAKKLYSLEQHIWRFYVKRLLLFTALFTSSFSFASTSNFQTRNIGIQDGLSQISVTSIAQDIHGNLWLGTQAGIDKFNGKELISIDDIPSLRNKLSGNLVYDLTIHKQSNDLWIATMAGLDKLDANSGQLESIPLPQANTEQASIVVRALYFDEKSHLWIGTNKGLFIGTPNTDTNTDKTMHIRLVSDAVDTTDVVSKNNIVYLSSKTGLHRFNSQTKEWLPPLLNNKSLTRIIIDKAGRIWAGSSNSGVFQITFDKSHLPQSIRNLSVQQGLLSPQVNDLIQLNTGVIWVASSKGINLVQEDFHSIKRNQVITIVKDKNVLKIFQGKDGTIFYGTLDTGLYIVNHQRPLFNRAEIPKAQAVYDIEILNESDVLVSTDQGLWLLNEDLQAKLSYDFSHDFDKDISHYAITSICHCGTQDLTFLASSAGLGAIDHVTNTVEHYDLKGTKIYTLAKARNEKLWLGTYDQGLLLYDPQQKQVLASYPMPHVSYILSTHGNQIFASTIDGLYVLEQENGIVAHFRANGENSLHAQAITSVLALSDGDYLLGTLGKGVERMSTAAENTNASFTRLFTDTPIATLSIGAMEQDDLGNIWLSTNKNIVKISRDLSRIEFFDGYTGVNSSGYFIGAHATDKFGRIFFPGVSGLSYFHPSEILKPKGQPLVQFTKFSTISHGSQHAHDETHSLAHHLLKPLDSMHVSPDVIMMSIGFAAIEYNAPNKIKYAYRLLGFDKHWREIETDKQELTFTNLSAGYYQLQVKSTNPYGEWSGTPATLQIEVTPPWWQRKPVIMVFVLASFGFLYILYKWRVYSLERQSARLTKLVEEKTSALTEANMRLRELVTLDPLTGILNRRGFNQAAARDYAAQTRTQLASSIIMFDIDFFKKVNDSYGHEIGDIVLNKLSDFVKSQLRSSDVFSRWGGEEFIILLPATELEVSTCIAEKLRKTVSEQLLTASERTISLTITCGVVEVSNSENLEEAIRRADALLYQGKNMGRNTVVSQFKI